MMAEMDYQRIVLGIVTNLNTRLVVVPLRNETVGDIRGTIKSYHREVFPTWGEVEVNALEVELLSGRSRVADRIRIGHLFRQEQQVTVFAELSPSNSNTLFELHRLKLAGAPELNTAPELELRPNFDEKLTSLVEGHVLPDLRASAYSNLGKSVSDHGNGEGRHGDGCDPVFVERQLRKNKREIDERVNVNDVGEMQAAAADCVIAEVVGPVTKKSCISRGHPGLEHNEPEMVTSNKSMGKDLVTKSMLVIESKLKSISTDGPRSCQQLGPSVKKKWHDEVALLTSDPREKETVVRSTNALDVRHESNRTGGSGSSSKSDHPVAEKLQAEPGLSSLNPTQDSVTKPKSRSADLLRSGGQSGLPDAEKVQEEQPALGTSKPANMEIGRKPMVAEATSGSSSSESEAQIGSRQISMTRGRQTDKVEVVGLATPEKKVPSGSLQNLNVSSKRGSLETKNKRKHSERHETHLFSGTTSGGSISELGGQNENTKEKGVVSQGKDHSSSSSSDCNNEKSDPEEGIIKSGQPGKNSSGKITDQTTSDGDSSQQSSEGSESEDIESTSDESDGSEEMPRRGRDMDFSTPQNGIETAKSMGRRRSGALVDLKYQHLLDSQDGFDELISLSQQKSKVFPASQQSVAGPHDSVPPSSSLPDDSLSIDLVPDTQVSQNDLTAVESVQNKIKEKQSSLKETAAVSRSVVAQVTVPAEPIQDRVEHGENLQCTPVPSSSLETGKIGLLLSVKEELTSAEGGTTEKVVKPGEEPPQAKSEDSQEMHAAVQLARMSMAKGVTSPSKNRMKRNAEVQSEKCSLHEGSNHDGESAPIRDATVISLLEGDEQMLETNRLSAPNQNMGVGEELGNVLLASEEEGEELIIKTGSTNGDGTETVAHLAEDVVATEADLGKKKHRKKGFKLFQESETEMPQEDTGEYLSRVEEEVLDFPENANGEPAANKEHSGKTSVEYRDLPKKSGLATTYLVALETKRLTLKQQEKVPKFFNKRGSKGAVDEHTDLPGVEANEPVGTDPGKNSPPVSILNRKEAHLEERIGDGGDTPSEIIQKTLVELQLTNSQIRKKKKKKDRSEGVVLQNARELLVEVNQKDTEEDGKRRQLEEDTERGGNLGLEEHSGPVSKRGSKDAEIENERPVGSQGIADLLLNGDPPQKRKQERRRLAVEFSAENSSGQKKQSSTGKKDKDSRQDHNNLDRSSSPPPQKTDFDSDNSLQQVQDTEEGDEEDLDVSNEDNSEADKESPTVLHEQTKISSKRSGRGGTNASKKVRNLETSLMRDQKIKRTRQTVKTVGSEGAHVSHASTKNVEEEHPPTGEVPAVERSLGGSLKNKRKKKRNLSLEPLVEAENGEAHQLDLDDGEDQVAAAPESPEIAKKLNLEENNGRTVKKRARKKKLEEEEESLPEDDAAPSKKKKVGGSKHSELSPEEDESLQKDDRAPAKKKKVVVSKNSELSPEEEESLPKDNGAPLKRKNVAVSKNSELSESEEEENVATMYKIVPAPSKKRVKSNEKRKGDSTTKKSPKRNAVGRFQIGGVSPEGAVRCPHGCGREFSKKTSAYFRHRKACPLVTTTAFGARE